MPKHDYHSLIGLSEEFLERSKNSSSEQAEAAFAQAAGAFAIAAQLRAIGDDGIPSQ